MNPIKNTILIDKTDFEKSLFNLFGLKVDYDMICKYLDTYPQNQTEYNIKHPKVFTIDFVDKTGRGWANIYSDFYKNHTKPKTELFKQFKEFINTYTFRVGDYFFIN